MIKLFGLEELEKIVAPEPLLDVLDTLKRNGLVASFRLDYRNGTVRVEISKNVEVAEFVAGLSRLDLGNESLKPRRTRQDDD